MHSVVVLVWYLRVNHISGTDEIDLPELITIQLCNDAFTFKDNESTELIMRSSDDEMK